MMLLKLKDLEEVSQFQDTFSRLGLIKDSKRCRKTYKGMYVDNSVKGHVPKQDAYTRS